MLFQLATAEGAEAAFQRTTCCMLVDQSLRYLAAYQNGAQRNQRDDCRRYSGDCFGM